MVLTKAVRIRRPYRLDGGVRAAISRTTADNLLSQSCVFVGRKRAARRIFLCICDGRRRWQAPVPARGYVGGVGTGAARQANDQHRSAQRLNANGREAFRVPAILFLAGPGIVERPSACQCQVKRTGPSIAIRPASVILTRATSTVRPRFLMIWRSAVASPSRTRSSSSGVNRARNKGSAQPCCPASASISSARRLLWLIATPIIQNVRSGALSGRYPGSNFLGR